MPLSAVTVCLCVCAVLARTISTLPPRRAKLILSSANWLVNDFLNERERRNRNVIFVWINHHYELPLVKSQVAVSQGTKAMRDVVDVVNAYSMRRSRRVHFLLPRVQIKINAPKRTTQQLNSSRRNSVRHRTSTVLCLVALNADNRLRLISFSIISLLFAFASIVWPFCITQRLKED